MTATKKIMVVSTIIMVITIVEENHAKMADIITGKTIKRATTKMVRIYTKNTVTYKRRVSRKFASAKRVESAIDSVKLTPLNTISIFEYAKSVLMRNARKK